MKRYFRIYKAILKINLSYILAYRANFFNSVFSSFAWGVFNFIWIGLLTSKTSHVFGWKTDELVVITIGYVLLTGIFYSLFSRNFESFSRIIDRGEFDGILLKPLDSQFQITMMRISYSSLIRTVMGIILLVWWIVIHHYSVGIPEIIGFVILVFVGVAMMYTIWFLFITVIIWYPNLGNMVELLYTINGFARYPVEMLKNSGAMVLLIFVPLSLIVSTPAKALLQKNAWGDIALLVVISSFLLYVSRVWWKHALKSYTSAS